jgi:hypothetical protein
MGLFLVAGLAIIASAAPKTVDAAAPAPPLDACLARGSFNLADNDCWIHAPAYGNYVGPIGNVVTRTVQRGETVEMGYPNGASIDFINPTRPCGDLACPHNTIVWRVGRSGVGMTHVSACGATDITCTYTFNPTEIGDFGEHWFVVFGEHYDGIYPVTGTAFAFYAPPTIYPVRLNPVDTNGDPLTLGSNDRAYAIKPGANPVAADCVNGWDWAMNTGRFEITPVAPPCIELTSFLSDNGDYFTGTLPVDTGDWTVVGNLAGSGATPLRQRASQYRPLTVASVADDITLPFVWEYRPWLDVDVHLDSDTMELGSTQTVEVDVRSDGGDAGTLSGLRFAVADILSVGSPNSVVEVVGPVEAIPAEGFSLAFDATRSFEVQIRAIALGTGTVTASATGIDDLGTAVSNADTDPITVTYVPPPPPPGGGTDPDAPKPPTMSRAIDYNNPSSPSIDLVQGYVEGAPGQRFTVTLVTSATDPCSKQMSGAGVTFLGTVETEVAANGYGFFLHRAPLQLNHFVYGIATRNGKWSSPGTCTRVTPNLPTLRILDASATEGTAESGTTPLSLMVYLSYASASTVTVQWSTLNGTVSGGVGGATSASDYTAVSPTTLTFAPGQTSKQITVDIVRDALDEPNERFFVDLSNAVNAWVIPTWESTEDGRAVATIIDDDQTTLPACTEAPFTDVGISHPFCREITFMKTSNISTGFDDGTYRPSAVVTRSAMSAFMARLAGATLPACTEAAFSDVGMSHPFCREITFMKTSNISTGFGDGTYRPSAVVTRSAMSAFMARLVGAVLPACTEAPFSDVGISHPFCREITFMKTSGISTGFGDGTYRPSAVVTRQAMSAFMYRVDALLP